LASPIFTIGHSSHSIADFIRLLKKHSIEVLCDVRTNPLSKFAPQFNRESLSGVLYRNRIRYVFLGGVLGGRPADPAHIVDGRASYSSMANSEQFRSGLITVRSLAQSRRVVLMCAEKDPGDCHRGILVSRELATAGHDICHILEDGRLETQSELVDRIITRLGLHTDLFRSRKDVVFSAYEEQEARIAWRPKPATSLASVST
jgi:uncharacterized protein (DUF488 family)